MQRRTFVGLVAGAAVCATGKFAPETRAESKPLDAARMLEVTRVPGVAVAGIKDDGPYQLFAGVEHAGGPAIKGNTFFPAASLSKRQRVSGRAEASMQGMSWSCSPCW